MKRNGVFFKSICAILVLVTLFSQVVYANTADETIGSMDKTVYDNRSVDQVYSDYKKNAFKASDDYKDSFIGLIGKIGNISANGKQITLESPSSDMNFICDCSDKKLKSQMKSLSSENKVIVCGKVKDPDEKEFKIKVSIIIPVKNEIKKYEDGMTSSDGTVFLAGELKKYDLGNNSAYIQSKWENQKFDLFWDEYIENEFNKKDGMVVQLTDDMNTEILGMYCFSYDECLGKANKDKKKPFYEKDKQYVEELLVRKLIKRDMTYIYGIGNIIKTLRTDNTQFDYLHGTKEEAGNTLHSELFFLNQGDDMIAITYLYTEKPKFASQVQLLVGSLKSQEQKK